LGASTNPTRGATTGEKFLCNQNKCHPRSLAALLSGSDLKTSSGFLAKCSFLEDFEKNLH